MKQKKKHILLTGGGTGGHIFPLVALAQKLAGKAKVSIVVEKGGGLVEEAFEGIDVDIYFISAGKLRRYFGPKRWAFFHPRNIGKNILDSGKVVAGFSSSLRLLKKIKPDIVFVKGGYVGLPVGLAAASLGLALVTHDSDALPGLTNRVLARWATKIAVGFPREHYRYPGSKTIQVGVPVREEFIKKSAGRNKHRRPRILIIGGSTGARVLNHVVLSLGERLFEMADIVHVSGETTYAAMNDLTTAWQENGHYKLYDFVGEDYFKLLAEADLVITRAGATAMAEFAIAGVPMILVPNPILTGGHQLLNATILEEASAAVVIGEATLMKNPEVLLKELENLLKDHQRQKWLVKNAASIFPAHAADNLAKLLIDEAG